MPSNDDDLERHLRDAWNEGSWVEVYSKSREKWFPAQVVEIYKDEDGEWLKLLVQGTMMKEVQRYDGDVRVLETESDSDGSEGEFSDSGDDSGELTSDPDSEEDDLLDDSDLDDEERERRRQKIKLRKQLATTVLIVQRAGTPTANGKYTYSKIRGGYPVFEHTERKGCRVWYKYDDEWVLEIKDEELYYAPSSSEWPPNGGWIVRDGEHPTPGIRFASIEQQEKLVNITDDEKYAPFERTQHEFFVLEPDEDLEDEDEIFNIYGFRLGIFEYHSTFVGVEEIRPGSQAEENEIEVGDLLVSVEGRDLAQLTTVEEVQEVFANVLLEKKKEASEKKQNDESSDHDSASESDEDDTGIVDVIFARRKQFFKIALVERAGAEIIKGKYTISGYHLDSLRFVKNDDTDFQILKIYEDDEKDEAIWAFRQVSDENEKDIDFYICLASCDDDVPPEYGWEGLELGIFPVPGVVYHDIPIEEPAIPVITRVRPGPGTAQIHFSVTEPRRPRVCPHMEVWCEVVCMNISRPAISQRVIKSQDSPVVFDKLTNGDQYQFIVKSCNQVAFSQSKPSPIVTPLELPKKPKITNIQSESHSLLIEFECEKWDAHDVQCQFEVILDPSLPRHGMGQEYQVNQNGNLLVERGDQPIRLINLQNGTKYNIILAAVNEVGVTYSEPERAYPSLPPQVPVISRIETYSREVTVYFDCPNFENSESLSWFEVDLEPDPPLANVLTQESNEDTNENTIDLSFNSSNTNSAKKRRPQWRKSRRKKGTYIPEFRRARRFEQSPIRLSPLVNGQAYRLRVKSVNFAGVAETDWTEYFIPEGPPPIPRIINMLPREDSVLIEFECDDYAKPDLKATFEVETFPSTSTVKCRTSPVLIPNLQNGIGYGFSMRAVTLEMGRSKWCPRSPQSTPLRNPPEPIEIHAVPGDKEVTVYWVCEEIGVPEFSAWFEVISDPPKYTMVTHRRQARFRRLDNDTPYSFRVFGVNEVGRTPSVPSEIVTPSAEISKADYEANKKSIACVVQDRTRTHRKEVQREKKSRNTVVRFETRMNRIRKIEKSELNSEAEEKARRAKKQRKLREKRAEQKEEERVARRQQKEDMRKRVSAKKRRISVIHRARIENLQKKWKTPTGLPALATPLEDAPLMDTTVPSERISLAEKPNSTKTSNPARTRKRARRKKKVKSDAHWIQQAQPDDEVD